MSLSHTHDLICHFKRMEKVLFRIWTLVWDICGLLGGSIWKAIAHFSSPLVAQLVRDCMTRRHRVSCEQQEFLAAPRVGLEWQKGLEQHLSLFQGAYENFPTLCLWEVKGTFSKAFLSQVRKPSNETQGPVPSSAHHRKCSQGLHLKHWAISLSTKKSNPGSPRLCLYRGSSWHSFWKPHYSTRAIPEEHLGRQPFKGEFVQKVCFYSRTQWRGWSFWCCWAALQQKIPHSINSLLFIFLLVCKMVLRKVNECIES